MYEDNFALICSAQSGDPDAEARLVEENTGLIWSIARRYFGRGTDPEDLFQLGCVGFLKAVRAFDTGFGTCFSTYAVPKIAGEIRRFLRDDGMVKVSRGLKEQSGRLRTLRVELEQRYGRELSISELAAAAGLSPEEAAAAEAATGSAESLQKETGEEHLTLEHILGDDGQEDRLIERFSLDEAMEKLPERERMVISLRFFHDLTQERASRVLGISQVQVSRLERRALEALRQMLLAAET